MEKFATKEEVTFDESIPEVSNRELWLGRNSDELLLHPIFASLPLERRKTNQGIEVFSFQNSGGTSETQSCNLDSYYNSYTNSSSGKGSCETNRFEIKCSHIFYVNNDKVSDYKKVGKCYGDRFDFRPYDKNGIPIMTFEEKNYWDRLSKFKNEQNPTCKTIDDCKDGRFCEEGICKKGGLWGKLVNP